MRRDKTTDDPFGWFECFDALDATIPLEQIALQYTEIYERLTKCAKSTLESELGNTSLATSVLPALSEKLDDLRDRKITQIAIWLVDAQRARRHVRALGAIKLRGSGYVSCYLEEEEKYYYECWLDPLGCLHKRLKL